MSASSNHPEGARQTGCPAPPVCIDKPVGGGSLSPLAMLFGLFGAAAVWFFQTAFGEALTAQACFTHRTFVADSHWTWLSVTAGAVTACALLLGIAGVGVAWHNWRAMRDTHSDAVRRALDTGHGRRQFLALAGVLFSLLFLVGLVAAGLAELLVSPCSAWR